MTPRHRNSDSFTAGCVFFFNFFNFHDNNLDKLQATLFDKNSEMTNGTSIAKIVLLYKMIHRLHDDEFKAPTKKLKK